MSRIAATFEQLKARGRKALIPFITAGDPSPSMTVPLMRALAEAGADIIELGVPFSDPMADGPTIQRSSERALKRGMSLRGVLDLVARFRRDDPKTPIVLMGYANPIEAMGHDAFVRRAADAGVDGVLVVDYPPEEAVEFSRGLEANRLDRIYLLSPTSDSARIGEVGRVASGYVYYVSLKGVTGASHLDLAEIARKLPAIRAQTRLPIGVGFGIRDADTARAVAAISDAVVIGSRLVEEIERSAPERVVDNVSVLLARMRRALDESRPTAD
jgi:tryptophan synthase alpha chain